MQYEEAQVECQDLVVQAKRAIVRDDDSLERSITLKGLLVKFRNAADKARKAEVKPLNDKVKAINARWNSEVINPIKEAEAYLQEAALPYLEEKERKELEARKAVQLRLEEQALEIADRATGNAEKQAAELKDLADQYEKQGDIDSANELRRRAENILRDAEGKALEAIDSAKAASTAGASKVRSTYGGTGSIRRNWVFEVEDERKAIQHLIETGDLYDLLTIDEKRLRELVNERHEELVGKIPGIRVYQSKKLVSRV